ncbi:type II toxin-antitoxin system VapC family toxin [Streptomyces sp. 21So2-11]|uniref:type II toxin-antitoxin system VapC family toxin n=1 Tax=Streptomyces sp. 21So2-11 TaxID=3144408 RepID=UPI00321B52E3
MSLLYFDASAIAKLVRVEAETSALERWVEQHGGGQAIVTCDLAHTEVRRLLQRAGADEVEREVTERLLGAIAKLRLTPELLIEAGDFATGSSLRSLDAIHAVSALQLGRGVSWFVTYDKRQGECAARAGLSVASPH